MIDPCARSRCRSVFVDALGEELIAPRHIRRLNGQHNEGWQVVFESPSRYFGDAEYGGPERALEAAKKHLLRTWRPVEKKTARGLNPTTRRRTLGVRLVKREGSSGRVTWYAEASHPVRGQAAKRFRIGPSRDPALVEEAKAKASSQRKKWLNEHPVPIR